MSIGYLSGECDIPEIIYYSRKWGESNKVAYKKSGMFNYLVSAEISENSVYRIV